MKKYLVYEYWNKGVVFQLVRYKYGLDDEQITFLLPPLTPNPEETINTTPTKIISLKAVMDYTKIENSLVGKFYYKEV